MMRRPYRNETYLDLCSRMKQARPDLSITTDIIVGSREKRRRITC